MIFSDLSVRPQIPPPITRWRPGKANQEIHLQQRDVSGVSILFTLIVLNTSLRAERQRLVAVSEHEDTLDDPGGLIYAQVTFTT